jgi:hypothetical protein
MILSSKRDFCYQSHRDFNGDLRMSLMQPERMQGPAYDKEKKSAAHETNKSKLLLFIAPAASA